VSTYAPLCCGIATFTADLSAAVGNREVIALHPEMLWREVGRAYGRVFARVALPVVTTGGQAIATSSVAAALV